MWRGSWKFGVGGAMNFETFPVNYEQLNIGQVRTSYCSPVN